jgi:hypothetical protein
MVRWCERVMVRWCERVMVRWCERVMVRWCERVRWLLDKTKIKNKSLFFYYCSQKLYISRFYKNKHKLI